MFTRQIFAIKSVRKKFFFPFFRISKTYIFTLGSLSIDDGHVKNALQDTKLSRITVSILYPNNAIWNIEKLGQEFCDSHTTSWRTNHEKKYIYIKHW